MRSMSTLLPPRLLERWDRPLPAATAQEPADDPSVTVQMIDSEGNAVGGHGFPIHQQGACEAPDSQSAGCHYSPIENKHGFDNPDGFHLGDLPNVWITSEGTASAEFFAPRLALDADAFIRGSDGEDAHSRCWTKLDRQS